MLCSSIKTLLLSVLQTWCCWLVTGALWETPSSSVTTWRRSTHMDMYWWEPPWLSVGSSVVSLLFLSVVFFISNSFHSFCLIKCWFAWTCMIKFDFVRLQTRGVLPYFANFRLISELSTPFVNQRWVGISNPVVANLWHGRSTRILYFSFTVIDYH